MDTELEPLESPDTCCDGVGDMGANLCPEATEVNGFGVTADD